MNQITCPQCGWTFPIEDDPTNRPDETAMDAHVVDVHNAPAHVHPVMPPRPNQEP